MAFTDSTTDAGDAGGIAPTSFADAAARASAIIDATPEPADLEGAAPPAEPGTPAPSSAAPVDPFDDPATDHFPRTYVENLRRESQGYREKFVPYRDAFEGYDDADRDVWLQAVRGFRDDPVGVARWMREQADAILAGDGQQQPAQGAGAGAGADADAADRPVTVADLERFYADRERAQAEAQVEADRQKAEAEAATAIRTEAEQLGYKPDTRAFRFLLNAAFHEFGGDLKAAHAALEADKKGHVDSFLAGRRGDADHTAHPVPPTGGTAPAAETPKTWEQARAASAARRNSPIIGS